MDAATGAHISAAADVLGDRWTLLVLRDIVFDDRRHFRALLTGSAEGIASNILADRLKRLLDAGILARGGTVVRGQRARFHLTEAGIQTVPILLALDRWGAARRPDAAGPQDAAAPPGHDRVAEDLMVQLRVRHRERAPGVDDDEAGGPTASHAPR